MQGKLWEKQWGSRALWSPGTNRSAGVGLLLHPESAIEVAGHNIDMDGRVISAKLKHNHQSFQILNVYALSYHSECETFFATCGISCSVMSTLLWWVILIVCQMSSWKNGEVMTPLGIRASCN